MIIDTTWARPYGSDMETHRNSDDRSEEGCDRQSPHSHEPDSVFPSDTRFNNVFEIDGRPYNPNRHHEFSYLTPPDCWGDPDIGVL